MSISPTSFEDAKVSQHLSPATVPTNIDFDPDYPGKIASFELTHGWQILPDRRIVRQMTFTSLSSDSLLSSLRIIGFRTGDITLEVDLRIAPSEKTLDYFNAKVQTPYIKQSQILFGREENFSALFQLVVRNNLLPLKQSKLLDLLVQTKDWTKVTPLQPGEQLMPLRGDY